MTHVGENCMKTTDRLVKQKLQWIEASLYTSPRKENNQNIIFLYTSNFLPSKLSRQDDPFSLSSSFSSQRNVSIIATQAAKSHLSYSSYTTRTMSSNK